MALRLHSRLVVLNGAAICVVTLLLGYFLGTGIKSAIEKEIEEELYRSAGLAGEFARHHPDRDNPILLAKALSSTLDVRVTLIAADGRVLGDSELDEEETRTVANHSDRPEVIDALKSGRGSSVRWSATVSSPFIYVAVLIDGRVLRLAMPLETLDLFLAGIRHQLLPLVMASAGLTLLFGYLVYAFVSRPLRRMAEASQELAIGNLDREIPVVGDIDLARVGSSLNSMAKNLRLRMEELKEEKRQLAAIVEAMSAGVVVFDRHARALLANRAIRQLLELPGELAGRMPMELVRHSAMDTAVRQALNGEEVPAVDLTTGGGRVLLAKATPVRLLSGQVESAVVVFYDLTEVRRTEKMRKDFVANVSHEFKTPLTSIRGYAETLLNAAPESKATVREFLQAIERNAGLLEALVEDLLVLAHLEADPPVEKQPLDVRSLIDRQVDSRRRMLDEKKIEVHLDCPEIPVSADRARLERAVSNLLDNAIYYNRVEGQIHITTRQVPGGIAIDVADTGMGISPEELLRVFERFYRVEKSRARDSGGTGLGLAIARHAVESQGGSIAVSSKLGVGSTFTITLPGE